MKNIFFIVMSLSFFAACENKTDYDVSSSKNYDESKMSLEQIEQKSPSNFLVADGERKNNILGQSVVKGKIKNRAKIVSYKDIDVKISFYSKTGTLLEEDHEIIYETVAPGTTKKFKSKYFTPKGTDSVAFSIAGAKY
ncbi:MAG: hypothetical protein ACKVOM_10535 [Ferruginibacter sp.]